MILEDTGARSEGAVCVWTATNNVVGSTRACRMMRRSSRRLVCQGRPEPGRRVNDTSSFHWLRNLLTVKSEQAT
ncbi:hypothetical protein TNCV_2474321 [Trichonephila clavipes]|nr:hypothetical protein TNCV_2474321 [Trichonephila clavipes]